MTSTDVIEAIASDGRTSMGGLHCWRGGFIAKFLPASCLRPIMPSMSVKLGMHEPKALP